MNPFTTTDIFLAATLLARNHHYRMVRLGKQASFVFTQATNISSSPKQDAENYYNSGLLVDPKTLFNAFKELKVRINDF